MDKNISESGNLSHASLSDANLSDADLRDANLRNAKLSNADMRNANLSYADMRKADLRNSDMRKADLRYADLAGANLSGANLTGVLGLGSKAEEIKFAKTLLEFLKVNPGALNMDSWHGENKRGTTHDLAGFYAPDSQNPGAVASRALPTLAKYFYSGNFVVMQALERVASGKESVF